MRAYMGESLSKVFGNGRAMFDCWLATVSAPGPSRSTQVNDEAIETTLMMMVRKKEEEEEEE